MPKSREALKGRNTATGWTRLRRYLAFQGGMIIRAQCRVVSYHIPSFQAE